MALKIIKGVIGEAGAASALASETGPTGTSWNFVRFSQPNRRPVILNRVVADKTLGPRVAPQQAGRFAFYPHEGQSILCGFSNAEGVEIAAAASDPAAIAAEATRTPAKRKIFWGVLLIPTIVGMFFAFDMIKAGRATLREHPAPKRPGDKRLTRALKGQLYWPF